MVSRMIKDSRKGVLIAKLSTSNEAITKIKNKCKDIWLIIKQVWYVPFIWSLAWFSYWIFQESIVPEHSLTQGNYSNYLGLAISIAGILLAGYISGKSRNKDPKITGKAEVEKKSSLTLNQASPIQDSQEALLSQELFQEKDFDKSSESEQQSRYPLSTEPSKIKTPDKMSNEKVQNREMKDNSVPQDDSSFNAQEQQDIALDCLICPNLTSCDHRQKITAESKSECPLARMNSKKYHSESQQD